MNPDEPQTPREALEVRITASLMGELSPREAEELQAIIAADPDLLTLQNRLRQAMGLLAEAIAEPPAALAPMPALRLSAERRERLLAHFHGKTEAKSEPAPGEGTIVPMPSAQAPGRSQWMWGLQLAMAAGITVLLASAVLIEHAPFSSETPDFSAPTFAFYDLNSAHVPGAADLKPSAPAAEFNGFIHYGSPIATTAEDKKMLAWQDQGAVDAPAAPAPKVAARRVPIELGLDTKPGDGAEKRVAAASKQASDSFFNGDKRGSLSSLGGTVGFTAATDSPGIHASTSEFGLSGKTPLLALGGTPAQMNILKSDRTATDTDGDRRPALGSFSADFTDLQHQPSKPAAKPAAPMAGRTATVAEAWTTDGPAGRIAMQDDAIAPLPESTPLLGDVPAVGSKFRQAQNKGGKESASDARSILPAVRGLEVTNGTVQEFAKVDEALSRSPAQATGRGSDGGGGGGRVGGFAAEKKAAVAQAGREDSNQRAFRDADSITKAEPEAEPEAKPQEVKGLAKTGSGTLTLSGTNNYTGGTMLSAGTLVLGDGSAPARIDYGMRVPAGPRAQRESEERSAKAGEDRGDFAKSAPNPDRGSALDRELLQSQGIITKGLEARNKSANAVQIPRDRTVAPRAAVSSVPALASSAMPATSSAQPGSPQVAGGLYNFRVSGDLVVTNGNGSKVLLDTASEGNFFDRYSNSLQPGTEVDELRQRVELEGDKAGVSAPKANGLRAFKSLEGGHALAKDGRDDLADKRGVETKKQSKWQMQTAPGRPEPKADDLKPSEPALEKAAEARADAEAPASAPKQPAPASPEPAMPAAKSPPLEFQPEVSAAENAFSTFSLNVSDVAFKLAAASLERGLLPDPGAMRSEEFLNALDYHDPEPQGGAPLAFAAERARDPFAQNRDILRFSVKTAAAGRTPGRPLNLVLLLDNSGSMERADRVRIVQEALRVLSAQLTANDKLSIVTFSRTPQLWADGVAGDQAAATTERVSEITPQGGTNLEAALQLGYETAHRHGTPGSISRVVLLTDGAANLGNVNPETLQKEVNAERLRGVALDCFGIGWEGYNDDLLEQLTHHGDGRYGFINTPEEASANFAGQLAGALRVAASDVKVQVEWNPRRVTAWRQVGYAKHQLTKEQFRDNSVDAAEIGAAESGNALYAVQVNPQGSGDLATVRVRYKVPGTNEYHEQEWPVPFTGHAVPLEQSSPALRLAVSASALAEQLAASPYATEVTSDALLRLISGLPAIYGADPRPQKLEWMIRQTKSLTGR